MGPPPGADACGARPRRPAAAVWEARHRLEPLADLLQARGIGVQAQVLLRLEIRATPQPRNGGQIMGRDRRQRAGRVARRRRGLKPEEPVRQEPVGIQLVPRRGFDRPQILADHKGLGARALQGEDRQELVGRIAHKGAQARLGLPRNPEEAKQAHHMVNAQARRMAEGGLQGVAQRLVGGRAELVRHKGRQAPVLAEGIEFVRGRADRHVRGEEILPDPGISAIGIDANGQIVHHRQGRGHAG